MEMINVKNDWSWAKNHVQQSMIQDKQLQENVLKVAIKHRVEVDNIIELYLDGVETGIENSKYLSFKSWFHEFFYEEL